MVNVGAQGRSLRRAVAARYFRWRSRPPLTRRTRPPRPPDFVGVGAQRCGTSWWHSLIERHPDVHALGWPFKELHFFDHRAGPLTPAEIRSYHEHFRAPAGRCCGEWTPRYLFDTSTPALLRAAAPDARLLVLLRDPVDRFVSGLSKALGEGMDAVSAWDDAFRRGEYHSQLVRLLEHFPADQLLVLQMERCRDATDHELSRTLAFIGVDPERYPGRPPALPVNRARHLTYHLSNAERQDLVEAYRPDVDRLVRAFPDIDVTRWPNFAGVVPPPGR